MHDDVDSLMTEFLSWVAAQPRSYFQAMDAWRSSCPRQTVWEDAATDGFIRLTRKDSEAEAGVSLTPKGRAALDRLAKPPST